MVDPVTMLLLSISGDRFAFSFGYPDDSRCDD
jgi:hypothetical protein